MDVSTILYRGMNGMNLQGNAAVMNESLPNTAPSTQTQEQWTQGA